MLDPGLQFSRALGREKLTRSVAMTVAKTRADRKRSVAIATPCGAGCGQQLVGNLGHRADNNHTPLPPLQTARDNFGCTLNGHGIFDRSAAELHDYRFHTETAACSPTGASLPC